MKAIKNHQTELEELSIVGNDTFKVTDADVTNHISPLLQQLRFLKKLNLDFNELTSNSFLAISKAVVQAVNSDEYISEEPLLSTLSFKGNMFARKPDNIKESMNHLFTSFPQLREVNLESCSLGDQGVAQIMKAYLESNDDGETAVQVSYPVCVNLTDNAISVIGAELILNAFSQSRNRRLKLNLELSMNSQISSEEWSKLIACSSHLRSTVCKSESPADTTGKRGQQEIEDANRGKQNLNDEFTTAMANLSDLYGFPQNENEEDYAGKIFDFMTSQLSMFRNRGLDLGEFVVSENASYQQALLDWFTKAGDDWKKFEITISENFNLAGTEGFLDKLIAIIPQCRCIQEIQINVSNDADNELISAETVGNMFSNYISKHSNFEDLKVMFNDEKCAVRPRSRLLITRSRSSVLSTSAYRKRGKAMQRGRFFVAESSRGGRYLPRFKSPPSKRRPR